MERKHFLLCWNTTLWIRSLIFLVTCWLKDIYYPKVYICNSRSWDLKFQIWDDPELHNQLQDRPDWIEKHQQTKKSNKIFYKIWIKIIQMNITDICTIICSHPNVVVLYKIFKITISIMLKFTISYLTKFIKILKLYSGGFQYQRL